jgi:hypothetical protein
MVAMKRGRVQPAVGLDRPAILAEFHHILSHGVLPSGLLDRADVPGKKPLKHGCNTRNNRPAMGCYVTAHQPRISRRLFSTLPADGLYAFDPLYSERVVENKTGKRL